MERAEYQLGLFGEEEPRHREEPELSFYEKFIVAFSGGKDSLACLLHLLELGIPKEKIELWHHRIDGVTGSLMDWPITESYCQAIADALDIPLLFSWKEGGFEREMLRSNTATAPIYFQTPEGLSKTGGLGPVGTRHKFPQVSANLAVRWCSAYLKIDVAAAALRNDRRFQNSRTLVITGERAEESPGRAKYATFEPHKADRRHGKLLRHIDHWRPVHQWPEEDVWAIIERHRINPHPAYWLGFGRVSCMKCIFGSPNQWATVREIDPDGFNTIADYEKQFGLTIHRLRSVTERADEGIAYKSAHSKWRDIALSKKFEEPIFLDSWKMPDGAFGESVGPS